MPTKQEYDEGRAKVAEERKEQEALTKLTKAATLSALSAVVAFFTGKGAINIYEMDVPAQNGMSPIKGKSVRFVHDPRPAADKSE